jgi:phage tail-like protein
MPGFTATALTYDPYRKFKFLVKWNGAQSSPVAAVHKVSSITKSIDAIEWRTGGDSNFGAKVPGLTKWEPITLERGLSADTDFQAWMNLVNTFSQTGGTSGAKGEAVYAFRKNLQIEMYNLQNDLVMTIHVYNAWPSKLTVADFDAKANEIAIEHLELQNEGWSLDVVAKLADERPAKG